MNRQKLPFHFSKTHEIYIESIDQENIRIAHTCDFSVAGFLELQRWYPQKIACHRLDKAAFNRGLAQLHEQGAELAAEAIADMKHSTELPSLMASLTATEELLDSQDDAPVIKLINALLSQAVKEKASDIHIETFEDRVMVRFRIDGQLQAVLEPPRVLAPLLISRLKIMAKLDIAEKRLPQDGRISLKIAGRAIDVRLSTIPAYYGERIVLRLLDKESVPLNLASLGMQTDNLQVLQGLIAQPHGILLVTGPTGSGKTTTLYASLSELNKVSRNILTIEDPIEYYLAGIGQTQVNPKVNMTFARGLRAILRQDPDVVMVGEIRDLETAKMAVQASLTGHLVLSTLHTNSAIGAMTRLRDMGVESFLLASSVKGVVAQRLVRRLCVHCKSAREADNHIKSLIGFPLSDRPIHYQAVGCEQCRHTGYQGRTGIYEVIEIDNKLRQLIHENIGEAAIKDYVQSKHKSLAQDGWQQVIQGNTSVAEILRVTSEENNA